MKNPFEIHAEKMRDELGPDYPEAVVALIDAIRDYIRNIERDTKWLLEEGEITSKEVEAIEPEMIMFRQLLAKLEACELGFELRAWTGRC